MIQELLYTSHEGRGLRQGGGGGYCTVLSTEGMASNLAAALEKLSGYKHPFDIHDPRSRQNPVNWRHAIIRVGGVAYHVLSRIADLKGEHTGRSNKLAHHVVLTQADQVPGGPTRLLMHPGFSRIDWDGKVELVHAVPRSSLPTDDLPTQVCGHWQAAGGDAGLAGHVADLLQSVPNPTVSVIFPLGADALALVDEVFSLLAPQKRWNTTFSTYFAAAPPISSCHLRFILDGTPDAELLRRDHRQTVIDLVNPPSPLAETPLVAAARSGVRLKAQPDAPRARQTSGKSNPENAPGANEERTANQLAAMEPLLPLADGSVLPPIHAEGRAGGRLPNSSPRQYRHRQATTAQKQQSKEKWALKACILISISLCAGGAVAFLLRWSFSETPPRVVKMNPKDEGLNEELSLATKTPEVTPTPPPKHTVVEPTSKALDAAPVSESTKKGELPSEESNANAAGAPSLANGVQSSPEGSTSEGSTNTEPPAVAPAATPEETTITLLEGPQIPMLSHLEDPLSGDEVGSAEPLKGDIDKCHLIGLEWISNKWEKSSLNKESLQWISTDTPYWKVAIPEGSRQGLPTPPKSICNFEVRSGTPIFSWNKKDTNQKIQNQPEKAAILNGLRWCILLITTKDGLHHYFRLSAPQPPKECNLFQSEQKPQPLLDTALPAFDVNVNSPVVSLTVESHPLSITQKLDRNGSATFRYPETESDYIQFKIVVKEATDRTSELICDHQLSYQVLEAGASGVSTATRSSPDISAAVQGMQALLDDRNRKIENMEEATPKSPNVNSDEWKKKKERLALLRSDQKQLDDRIKALKSLEQTYMTLNGGLATVTLNLIYATPDSKVGIPVPVLSRDAIGP